MNITPSEKIEILLQVVDEKNHRLFNEYKNYIIKLNNLKALDISMHDFMATENVSSVKNKFQIYVLKRFESLSEKQISKTIKEIDNLGKYLEDLDKKLSNENFLTKASSDVIEKEKKKQVETKEKLKKLKKLIT